MVIPVQLEVQDANILEYLALIFSHDFLLSIRNSKMARFQKSITSKDSSDLLPDSSIAGIISSLMMGLSLDCLRKAARLSDKILVLEEQMDREPTSVKIDEISDKRSELLTLESIVQGQLPIIEAIISSEQFFNHFRKYPGNISYGQPQILNPPTKNWIGWSIVLR